MRCYVCGFVSVREREGDTADKNGGLDCVGPSAGEPDTGGGGMNSYPDEDESQSAL